MKKMEEQFGEHFEYDLYSSYVGDLGKDIIKDIIIEYYLFLSGEIIEYENVQLLQNKDVLNLLAYRVGLH